MSFLGNAEGVRVIPRAVRVKESHCKKRKLFEECANMGGKKGTVTGEEPNPLRIPPVYRSD